MKNKQQKQRKGAVSQNDVTEYPTGYQFLSPIHQAVLLCMLPEGKAVHNGHVLTDIEQRVLAYHLYAYGVQNAPPVLRAVWPTIKECLQKRHPKLNLDVDPDEGSALEGS